MDPTRADDPAYVENPAYVDNPFASVRRLTRVVRVGDVAVGGDNPIRIQSMTTTDTRDTRATADQIEALAGVGCEIARVAAPSIRDAESLADLKAELQGRGVRIPLVADIHFTPNAAMIAALHVEKVRINPGNYADKKKFETRGYSDAEYAAELERVAGRFRPLVRRCREEGRALRIGTNHGSLSDRIMNRFGDTPRGMVESALEFLDVCEDEGYDDVVFSMKASNTQVAIQAYRLLAMRLGERTGGGLLPFHVGVTEAGDGEDGRIKSAIGIGSLLEDGLGDTIRVSLTEDPVREVPVAAALARRAEGLWRAAAAASSAPPSPGSIGAFVRDPYAHERREVESTPLGGLMLGSDQPVRVELDLGEVPAHGEELAKDLAASLAGLRDVACEGLQVSVEKKADLPRVRELVTALAGAGCEMPLALRMPVSLAAEAAGQEGVARFVVSISPEVEGAALEVAAKAVQGAGRCLEWSLSAENDSLAALVDRALDATPESVAHCVSVESATPTHAVRLLAARLLARGRRIPVVLRHRRRAEHDEEAARLAAAVDLGAPLCDGIGDAVSLVGFTDPARAVDLAYRILQGARLRTTRTEFISCPSCGRTLFDLEETTAKIKSRTEHLKGVKIAVMGCIVNGPGEMADADFGYVGSGVGQVTLYVGKQVVARAVPAAEAPDRLVEIIRDSGRWVDPA